MKANEYRKQAQQKQVTQSLALPSGAVFLMRLAPIQQWTTTGLLPASLAAKMQLVAQADKAQANEIVLKHYTEKDFVDSQNMGRRMLEYCCLEPKIFIEKPGEPDRGPADDELSPEDILPEDFEAIMRWIWSGGEQGESLAEFRNESGQSVKPRHNGSPIRKKAKRALRNRRS